MAITVKSGLAWSEGAGVGAAAASRGRAIAVKNAFMVDIWQRRSIQKAERVTEEKNVGCDDRGIEENAVSFYTPETVVCQPDCFFPLHQQPRVGVTLTRGLLPWET